MKKYGSVLLAAALTVLCLLATPFSAAAGQTKGGIELPMIPGTCSHSMGEWTVTQEATCTQTGVQTRKCKYCGYKQTQSIAPTGHSFSQWTVTESPALGAQGQRQRFCTVCGETETESIPCLTGKVAQWSMDLQDDLQVVFLMEISPEVTATANVCVKLGEGASAYGVATLQKNGEGYYEVRVPVAAAQMTDPITLWVENGIDASARSSYTVRQYADTVLADDSYSRYHATVKAMLSYGGRAQEYFHYGKDALADVGITVTDAKEIPETVPELAVSGKLDGISFYAASLVYRDKVAVRYYFRGTGDYTFTADGKSYTPVEKDGLYYIEVPGIPPENLDRQITLTVTDGDGNALTVSYSPMHYMVRMNQKGSDSLKELLKALYNYHLAAKALRTTE